MKTHQEVYSEVRNHLLNQAERAGGDDGCKYLDQYGLTCAIGCLVPKEHYDPAMEDVTIRKVRMNRNHELTLMDTSRPKADALEAALIASAVPLDATGLNLLEDLQNIHDEAEIEVWEDRLDSIAVKYNLSKE